MQIDRGPNSEAKRRKRDFPWAVRIALLLAVAVPFFLHRFLQNAANVAACLSTVVMLAILGWYFYSHARYLSAVREVAMRRRSPRRMQATPGRGTSPRRQVWLVQALGIFCVAASVVTLCFAFPSVYALLRVIETH